MGSITLYDREGFQVANSLNRFAVSSWMPFKYKSLRQTAKQLGVDKRAVQRDVAQNAPKAAQNAPQKTKPPPPKPPPTDAEERKQQRWDG